MKQSFFVAAFAAAMTAFAVQAAQTYRIEECGPAAEAFSFYLDASGSMMETIGDVKEKAQEEYEKLASEGGAQTRERPVPPANDKTDGLRRAELAESLVLKSAGVAADKAGMTSSLYAVAPFAVLVPPEKRTAEAYGKAVRERFHNKMEVFGRPTWLGERGFKHFSAPRTGKEVAVLITDGHFDVRTEGKRSPVEALRAYGEANPGSCVHIVSAAYLPAEKKAVAELAQVLPCTKTFELEALMTDDAQFADFAETVFYKDCSKVAVVELQDVLFDFDKAELTAEGRAILRKALKVVESRAPSEHFTIVGWTDWTGSDAYNADLSQRRAEAVKAFFEENGVAAERMQAQGRGKSFEYDNSTKDGRRMNRRVELVFEKPAASAD